VKTSSTRLTLALAAGAPGAAAGPRSGVYGGAGGGWEGGTAGAAAGDWRRDAWQAGADTAASIIGAEAVRNYGGGYVSGGNPNAPGSYGGGSGYGGGWYSGSGGDGWLSGGSAGAWRGGAAGAQGCGFAAGDGGAAAAEDDAESRERHRDEADLTKAAIDSEGSAEPGISRVSARIRSRLRTAYCVRGGG
jgi:hypothetical protein